MDKSQVTLHSNAKFSISTRFFLAFSQPLNSWNRRLQIRYPSFILFSNEKINYFFIN